jgi:hypothetical protein
MKYEPPRRGSALHQSSALRSQSCRRVSLRRDLALGFPPLWRLRRVPLRVHLPCKKRQERSFIVSKENKIIPLICNAELRCRNMTILIVQTRPRSPKWSKWRDTLRVSPSRVRLRLRYRARYAFSGKISKSCQTIVKIFRFISSRFN